MPHFCSIASRYALPHVRVLADGLAEHHPEGRLTVLLLGDPSDVTRADDRFDLIGPPELELTALDDDLSAHGWADMAALLRPRLIEWMIRTGSGPVVYLEADVDVRASLGPFLSACAEHPVVLLPRTADGLPDDGLQPADRDLLAAGRISPSMIVVSDTEPGIDFLRWWSARLSETASGVDPGGPQATNLVHPSEALTRWLDIAPAVLRAGVAMRDDPGVGLSFWNVHSRPLTSSDNGVLAAGRPLRSVHFSGFRPDRPYWLSEHATRTRVIDDSVLASLCGSYAKRLLAAGWVNPQRHPDYAGHLADGTEYDTRVRRLHARAVATGERFGDVFTPDGTERLVSWLTGPAERGGDAGITRYLYDAYLERSDLQEALPEIEASDAPRLIEWAWDFGRLELDLQPSLLPGTRTQTAERQLGVNVIGHLTESLGLGQAARLYATVLKAAEVPVGTTGVPVRLPKGADLSRYGRQPFEHTQLSYDAPFRLVCVNPDAFVDLLKDDEGLIDPAAYTIGVWGWETDVIPAHWLPALADVDELWAYSRFTADVLSRSAPVPVVRVPLPILAPPVSGGRSFELDGDFVFLFAFDFFSTLQRKNPIGLIEAFTRAFSPGEGPRLVLKAINSSFRPEAADSLRWAIGERPDITVIDRHLSTGEYGALLARGDCYVSLHRAEGFGLTMAESMALGKPVIATGYSGNLDFMTTANSYLVDYALTAVGPDGEHYPAEGTWAEPDLDHAAALMRRVWERQDEARRRGERAAREVTEQFSPEAVGRIARARLELVAKSRSGAERPLERSANASAELAVVERRLAEATAATARDSAAVRGGGAARLGRRLLLRLMRPFTHHQQRLDDAIVRLLERLQVMIGSERARGLRDSARVRRLERRVRTLEQRIGDDAAPDAIPEPAVTERVPG